MISTFAFCRAVRGTVRTISPVQCPSNLPRGPLGDLFLHHPLSSRPIQSNHLRQSQNHSSMFTEWTAISQRLDHSSVALKPLGRGGVKCKALGKGDQPAPSGQQEVKSEPDKAPEPPQEQNLTDAMSESQYWRQLIDRSLGELSSSKGGVASNKYGGDVGDELGVGQSSGEAKGNVAAPEAIRATKSTPASSYTGPSSKPSPSGDVTPTQYPDSVVGSSALAGSRTPAHISRNRQSLVSGDAERAADSPEPDSQTPRQAGPSPFVEASRSSSEATPQDSAQSKPALNEAATPGPKTAFKRREIDPQKATGPGGGVPGRSRPQGAEPLRPEDWENMSNLLGMSVEELDRNSAGTGLTFEAAAPGPARGREADADVQQEKKVSSTVSPL